MCTRASWRRPLNRPCVAAMKPVVKILLPLVIFLYLNFSGTSRQLVILRFTGAICVVVANFTCDDHDADPLIAEIWLFIDFFQKASRPPSWVCCRCAGTNNEKSFRGWPQHTLYFCSKFGWNRCRLQFGWEFGLKTPIHAPQRFGEGLILTSYKMLMFIIEIWNGTDSCENTSLSH